MENNKQVTHSPSITIGGYDSLVRNYKLLLPMYEYVFMIELESWKTTRQCDAMVVEALNSFITNSFVYRLLECSEIQAGPVLKIRGIIVYAVSVL